MKNSLVPFNDLSRIHKPLLNKSLKNLEKTVLKNDLILSEDIRLFEEKYSEFTNQKYTVSCANGTDAIELILRALEIGMVIFVSCARNLIIPLLKEIIAWTNEVGWINIDNFL